MDVGPCSHNVQPFLSMDVYKIWWRPGTGRTLVEAMQVPSFLCKLFRLVKVYQMVLWLCSALRFFVTIARLSWCWVYRLVEEKQMEQQSMPITEALKIYTARWIDMAEPWVCLAKYCLLGLAVALQGLRQVKIFPSRVFWEFLVKMLRIQLEYSCRQNMCSSTECSPFPECSRRGSLKLQACTMCKPNKSNTAHKLYLVASLEYFQSLFPSLFIPCLVSFLYACPFAVVSDRVGSIFPGEHLPLTAADSTCQGLSVYMPFNPSFQAVPTPRLLQVLSPHTKQNLKLTA